MQFGPNWTNSTSQGRKASLIFPSFHRNAFSAMAMFRHKSSAQTAPFCLIFLQTQSSDNRVCQRKAKMSWKKPAALWREDIIIFCLRYCFNLLEQLTIPQIKKRFIWAPECLYLKHTFQTQHYLSAGNLSQMAKTAVRPAKE